MTSRMRHHQTRSSVSKCDWRLWYGTECPFHGPWENWIPKANEHRRGPERGQVSQSRPDCLHLPRPSRHPHLHLPHHHWTLVHGHCHRRSGDGTRDRQDTSHGCGGLAGRCARGRVMAAVVLLLGLVPLPVCGCVGTGVCVRLRLTRTCGASAPLQVQHYRRKHPPYWRHHSCLWGQVRPGGGAGAGAGAGSRDCGL
jgi:hypothetical protein